MKAITIEYSEAGLHAGKVFQLMYVNNRGKLVNKTYAEDDLEDALLFIVKHFGWEMDTEDKRRHIKIDSWIEIAVEDPASDDPKKNGLED